MNKIYLFFKSLQEKKGKNPSLPAKLTYAPEELTQNDLNIEGNLFLNGTLITSLPDSLKVGGNLYLDNTPLSKKYTEEEIKKMIEDRGGYVKKDIVL